MTSDSIRHSSPPTNNGASFRCTGPEGREIDSDFFWKPFNIKDRETEEEKQIMLSRTYAVFNLSQVEDAPALVIEKRPEIERHAECDRVIAETGAAIH